jgi:hypothetical protein
MLVAEQRRALTMIVLLEGKIEMDDDCEELVLASGSSCTIRFEIEDGKLRINFHPEGSEESAHLMIRRTAGEVTIIAGLSDD